MTPEERDLLKRSLELAEENNKILKGLRRTARWATFWGFIKVLIFVIPLIAGYLYFQPYFDGLLKNYSQISHLLQSSQF